MLGYAYESDVIAPDGAAPPDPADPIGEYLPTARTGHRAPHPWLEGAGGGRSVLDLYEETFVALNDSASSDSVRVGTQTPSSIPLHTHAIEQRELSRLYGIEKGGIVLVRPDGHVAWRSKGAPSDPATEFSGALRLAAGHTT